MIPRTSSLVILTVVMLQRLDQSCLGSKAFENFEVIVNQSRPTTFHSPLINPLIALCIIVDWPPYEMTLFNALTLIFYLYYSVTQLCLPLASSLVVREPPEPFQGSSLRIHRIGGVCHLTRLSPAAV